MTVYKTIPDLPLAAATTALDVVEISQAGTSRSVQLGQLFATAGPGPTSIKFFGAKGDGVTDDTAALNMAFVSLGQVTGGTLYIPPGTYMISNTVGAGLITKNIRVVMDPAATIQAMPTFPVDTTMVYFLSVPDNDALMLNFIWEGGRIDGSLRPISGASGADIINVTGYAFNLIALRDMFIYGGLDLLSGHTPTDSCVFIAAAHNIEVSGCWMQGATDAGVYISGSNDTTLHGDTCRLIGNNVRWCSAGLVSKRSFTHNVIIGNNIQRCSTAIGIVGTGDLPAPPLNQHAGRNASILSNYIEWCGRGIGLTNTPRAKVAFNQMVNVTRDPLTGNGLAGEGVYLTGTSYAQVAFNTVELDTSVFTPSTGSTGVRLVPATDAYGTYNSTWNDIHQNVITNTAQGVTEVDANQDYNNYSMNDITTLTLGAEFAGMNGVNSTWTGMRKPNHRYVLNYPNVDIGGPEGFPGIRVVRQAGGSNYWNTAGCTDANATGQGLTFNAAGTATNCSITIGSKGATGLVLLGGVGTANEVMRLTKASTQTNSWSVVGANTTLPPTLTVRGTDTNIGMLLTPKGTGSVQITLANVGNFTTDALAAAGGVPIGGIYRNASALQIRTV